MHCQASFVDFQVARCLPGMIARCLPPIVARCLPLWQNLSLDHNGRGTANMERIHMNIYTEIIYRLRAKESERRISRDLSLSRPTVHKYKLKALLDGYLDSQKELPEMEEIAKSL